MGKEVPVSASYVTKAYQRDYEEGSRYPKQLELYTGPFTFVEADDEARRLNEQHHAYMLATHDLREQGVEFGLLEESDFSNAGRLGIRLVQSDWRSRAWEAWRHLPVQVRVDRANLLSNEYHSWHREHPPGTGQYPRHGDS
jgi:hypothetical protein